MAEIHHFLHKILKKLHLVGKSGGVFSFACG